jgi:hypothetical protein
LLKGDEGKGERHEKDGGISHGGRGWRRAGGTVGEAAPYQLQCLGRCLL